MTTPASAFGAALKTWRNRLSPVDAGLPSTPGRRAAGLRREELAALAGLSVDYVVRLEQGRSQNPSAPVVASLARALQLDLAERDYLYRCAGLLAPPAGQISTHVPPGVQRLVARLSEIPLAVFTADWTLVMWSPLWATLIGDPLDRPVEQRNLVWAVFAGQDDNPNRLAPWPVHSDRAEGALEAALVADMRMVAAAYPADKGLADLIQRVRSESRHFAQLWDSGVAGARLSERKTIEHPLVGNITLDCDILTARGADLNIIAYTAAAGSPDAEKLDFLRVTGVREMTHPSDVP
ncbi:MAG: helix-turn-helix transcriptional regulator [Actinomycetota bacterium]|nr:helix-turn-helix transcriptional regulator [Actinomycetota bacterium]